MSLERRLLRADGHDGMGRYDRIRLSWFALCLWCLVALVSQSLAAVASAGIAIIAWSLSLALNSFGMIDELQARGAVSRQFDQPRRSYVAIGCVGVFVGLIWFAVALARLV